MTETIRPGDPGPWRPLEVGDWVSSVAYCFSGGEVIMDLGVDMLRVKLDRSEMTVQRRLVSRATEQEKADALARRTRIQHVHEAPHP